VCGYGLIWKTENTKPKRAPVV